MKKHLSTIILILILITGLSLLLYPTLSDYWNSMHQSKAIADYAESVGKIDQSTYEDIWNRAVLYNQELYEEHEEGIRYLTEDEKAEYESQLDVTGTGVMGYVEIPKINCSLTIYHGTNEEVLQTAIGNIEGSSLTVGGVNTHSVLSGHRGLPSAKLFSKLDQMETGDLFKIRVLNETLTYEVDQIRIVLPEETNDLTIEEGQDLCTLVTCTPYGINDHRLLVRGHRVANRSDAKDIMVTADAMQIEPVIVAPIIAIPILLILIILVFSNGKKKRRR